MNNEKRKERARNYYNKHREKRLASAKKYRDAHKDEINKKRRNNRDYYKNYKKENYEKLINYSKDYYYKNKERLVRDKKIKYKKKIEKRSFVYESTLHQTAHVIYHTVNTRMRKKAGQVNFDKQFMLELIQCALIELGDCVSLKVNSPTRVSVDRIDPTKSYTKDNIQIIPQWLNYAYHDFNKNEVNNQIIKFAEYLKQKEIYDK